MPAARAPRVSAIVTTYNYAAYISAALDSVLGQTRPPDEVVVIDDGSTDDTSQIVARYAQAGVRYLRQENQGAGAARNRGICETQGDLLAFLDADDLWLPDKLERQLACLAARPELGLVSGQMIWWDQETEARWIERFGVPAGRDVTRELVVRNVVGNPSMVLARRATIEAVGGFDPCLRWGQDWDLWIRLSTCSQIGFLPEPVMIYRWHSGSLSRQSFMTRLGVVHSISRRAIRAYTPRRAWPVLLVRVWSEREFDRARFVVTHDYPRRLQLWHAWRAFGAYPFGNTLEKGKLAVRATIGTTRYRRVTRRAAEQLERLPVNPHAR